MTEVSAEEHLRRMQWTAASWLSELEIRSEEYWDDGRGARWVLGKGDSFIHRCEIIAGIGGSLIVHGDFDVVRFACYGDKSDAFSRLCWMGLCTDVGYYVRQKAVIGMGRWRDGVDGYNEDVAKHELLERARSEAEDRPELAEILREAAGEGDAWGEPTQSKRYLEDFLAQRCAGRWDYWEWVSDFGRVLDAHVIVSHVALNRTACLLIERWGKAGPPQCRQKEKAA